MLRPRIELASEDMLDTFDVLIRKAFDEGKLLYNLFNKFLYFRIPEIND